MMDQLAIYLLRSGVSIVLFYACFMLILRKESYFRFNRAYLLGALLVSSALPFLSYDLAGLFSRQGATGTAIYLNYQLTAHQLQEVVIGRQDINPAGYGNLHPLILIYFAGMMLKLAHFLFRLIQLMHFSSRFRHHRKGNLVFVITREGTPTFSFLHYIFIAPELYADTTAFNAIIRHEAAHARRFHSIDLLIAELFIIVQWFNPFAYLMKKLINENHEFEADQRVLTTTGRDSEYRALLLAHASFVKTNTLTHNFSYSLIKRRLSMMKKPRNPVRFVMGILAVIATSAIVTMACSRTDRDTQTGEGIGRLTTNDTAYTLVENMPQFPGGMDSLAAFISGNLNYPGQAKIDGISGKVMIGFVVEKDGAVSEVKVIDGVGHGCDEEAVRVVKAMPDWTPGTQDGEAVRVSFVLPISFALDKGSDQEVHKVVEQMPEFPGGVDELISFTASNIRYPEEAKRDSVTGKVFVRFVIDETGQVGDIKILRGIGGGCDEEAVRVIKMMPKWEPGVHKGEAVKVEYVLPIRFALQ